MIFSHLVKWTGYPYSKASWTTEITSDVKEAWDLTTLKERERRKTYWTKRMHNRFLSFYQCSFFADQHDKSAIIFDENRHTTIASFQCKKILKLVEQTRFRIGTSYANKLTFCQRKRKNFICSLVSFGASMTISNILMIQIKSGTHNWRQIIKFNAKKGEIVDFACVKVKKNPEGRMKWEVVKKCGHVRGNVPCHHAVATYLFKSRDFVV